MFRRMGWSALIFAALVSVAAAQATYPWTSADRNRIDLLGKEATLGAIAGAVHSSVIYATPATPAGVPFETDPPANFPAINITLTTASQQVVPVRTPGTDTRHGLELQFIGTAGLVYCRWGAAATVSPGGYNFRLDLSQMPAWTMQLLPNGPPQAKLECIGSTSPAVAGSLVGTEYYK